MTVSINATISFTRAVSEGVLFADAREITRSKKLVTYEVRVTSEAGEILAVFLGTGYIKGKPVKVL